MKAKEYFYVGWYRECLGRFVVKIGTTNNLERRKKEHNKKYLNTPNYPIGTTKFNYVFAIPLSKYTTLRIEDEVREMLKEMNIGKYVRNDRFLCDELPKEFTFKVRKEYTVSFAEYL